MEKNNVQNLPLSAKDGGLAFSLMIIVYMVFSFFGQAIISLFCEKGSAVYIAISSVITALSVFSVTVYFSKSKKIGYFDICKVKKFKPTAIFAVLFLSIGMFFGLGFINGAFSTLLKNAGLSVGELILPLENVGHLILFSVVLALLPAVVEELFFRGLMLTALKNVKVVYAAIYIAISFALYHCSIAQLFYQLIYGAALTFLAVYAGSIIPCVIVHFINNFTVIILEYFNVGINLYHPLVISLGLVALAIYSVIIAVSLIRRDKKTEIEKRSAVGFYLPFGAFGTVICLALLIMNLFAV
ncbi:MAG: CPBP family intramembrane metalloprotease [Clostridia bacterium]|nr:CPBP family intramembrane metalloprotease [Clostridia bacterium]